MSEETTLPPRRRAADAIVDHLHECVEDLKQQVTGIKGEIAENTRVTLANAAVTQDVRDILTTFKTLGMLAKWLSGILASVAAGVVAWKSLRS
jgi:hypothetical protein